MSFESSDSVYTELSNKLGQKGLNSLKNVKLACDIIVSTRGQLNYSSVGRVALKNFGGPKGQSILNNDNLKRYVNARIIEYTQGDRKQKYEDKADGILEKKYPSENLDVRTKTYIDQMHTRLDLVEGRYKELRKWQEEFTKVNPIDYAALISKGPSQSGSMHIEYKGDDEKLSKIKDGIRSLLSLTEMLPTLEVEAKGDKKRLTLKRPSGDRVILTPDVLAALEEFVAGAS